MSTLYQASNENKSNLKSWRLDV